MSRLSCGLHSPTGIKWVKGFMKRMHACKKCDQTNVLEKLCIQISTQWNIHTMKGTTSTDNQKKDYFDNVTKEVKLISLCIHSTTVTTYDDFITVKQWGQYYSQWYLLPTVSYLGFAKCLHEFGRYFHYRRRKAPMANCGPNAVLVNRLKGCWSTFHLLPDHFSACKMLLCI